MIHPGLEALKGQWDKEEYAAGYRARLTAIPDFEGAHHFTHHRMTPTDGTWFAPSHTFAPMAREWDGQVPAPTLPTGASARQPCA